MYLSFYGLAEKPFANTPDPRFLYFTPGHREALAHLLYGVQEKVGFLLLTGEVGTGKTTLLHALRQRLDETTATAFIINSGLSFDGLLEYILEDLGIPTPGYSRAQRLVALHRFLIERRRAGENVAIVFDEAQDFDLETLEQIRLLSNFESPTDKLVQILLVGQPELKATLARPELRQLTQRIALRSAIPALSPAESVDYIRHRLQVAGAADPALFTERAVRRITEYAAGIPRFINIVCEHCLLLGYAEQTRRLDVDIVARAIEYLEDGMDLYDEDAVPFWRLWSPGRARAAIASLLVFPLSLARAARGLFAP